MPAPAFPALRRLWPYTARLWPPVQLDALTPANDFPDVSANLTQLRRTSTVTLPVTTATDISWSVADRDALASWSSGANITVPTGITWARLTIQCEYGTGGGVTDQKELWIIYDGATLEVEASTFQNENGHCFQTRWFQVIAGKVFKVQGFSWAASSLLSAGIDIEWGRPPGSSLLILTRNTSMSLAGANTWTVCAWNNEVIDDLNAWTLANGGVITVPSGVTRARITCYGYGDSMGATLNGRGFICEYNGSGTVSSSNADTVGDYKVSSGGLSFTHLHTRWITVTAGHQIRCWWLHTAAGHSFSGASGNAYIQIEWDTDISTKRSMAVRTTPVAVLTGNTVIPLDSTGYTDTATAFDTANGYFVTPAGATKFRVRAKAQFSQVSASDILRRMGITKNGTEVAKVTRKRWDFCPFTMCTRWLDTAQNDIIRLQAADGGSGETTNFAETTGSAWLPAYVEVEWAA